MNFHTAWLRPFAALALLMVWNAAAELRGEPREDVLIADFEQEDYGDWRTTGEAFGPGPAKGTLPGQMHVSGYEGERLVNSFHGGDKSTGTLTSPEFRIERKFINLLIGGGGHADETYAALLVDGQPVRKATGSNTQPGGTERLDWHTWPVEDLAGKMARIQIVDRHTGGWGHINVDSIAQSDRRRAVEIVADKLYEETHRPRFHFTAQKNWLNDPNGLVYHNGEYHLFFQHNPRGVNWGNMTWGHAVSKDLLHWRQLDHAITPDELGTIYSGSAVVDVNNTSGFGKDGAAPLVAIYTYAGSQARPKRPFTQALAYSLDNGRTFVKYDGNPVLKELADGNRDPKVFWHEPTQRWVMALYVRRGALHLFNSANLKDWELTDEVKFADAYECPELFPLALDGDADNGKWVLWEAAGRHLIGQFDGRKFTAESDVLPSEWGRNCYAGQTWNDDPHGRRIFIGWMRGGQYPRMPFNQQMSIPRELTLRTTADGPRLHAVPVREIASLRDAGQTWENLELEPGKPLVVEDASPSYELALRFTPAEQGKLQVRIGEHTLAYDAAARQLDCLGAKAVLAPGDGAVDLRVLVDRASIEVFAQQGRYVFSLAAPISPAAPQLAIESEEKSVIINKMDVWNLKPTWPTAAE